MGSTLTLVLTLLSVAWTSQPATAQDNSDPGEDWLVPIPGFGDINERHVKALARGLPVISSVAKGESDTLYFAAKSQFGKFPDISLWLTVINRFGDADLYCAPFTWVHTLGRDPDQTFYVWTSTLSQDTDELFLSTRENEYIAAVDKIDIEGNNETRTEVAAFACSVHGAAWDPSEYRLNVELAYGDRVMVPEEQQAMRAIYDACCPTELNCARWRRNNTMTDEDNVPSLDGSAIEVDFCHRFGSVCSEEGRLIRLDMRGYNLSCDFPTEHIGVMQSLVKIDMGRNELTGDIDDILTAFVDLENLTHISLERNLLSGSLDAAEAACPLFQDRLQLLNLNINNIGGGMLQCLFSAGSSLLEFHIKENMVYGDLPEFADLIPLEFLAVSGNELSGRLPYSIGNAEYLEFFHGERNVFSGPIPDSLGELSYLNMFVANDNALTGYPYAWRKSSREPPETLKIVEIGRNDLQGVFPIGLGNAKNLLGLDLSENRLTGPLTIEQGMFSKLLLLNLSFNGFEGPISDAWADAGVFKSDALEVPVLPRFDVRENNLSGEVPDFFYPENTPGVNRKIIFLSGNDFTCANPDALRYAGANCVPQEDKITSEDYQEEQEEEEDSPVIYRPVPPPPPPPRPTYYNPPPYYTPPRSSGQEDTSRSSTPPPPPADSPNDARGDVSADKTSKGGMSKVVVPLAVVASCLFGLAVVVVVVDKLRGRRNFPVDTVTVYDAEHEGAGFALMEQHPMRSDQTGNEITPREDGD